MKRYVAAPLLLLSLIAAPALADDEQPEPEELTNQTCLDCHGDAGNVGKKYAVAGSAFKSPPHTEDNGVTCASCHARAAKVEDVTDHGPLGAPSCDGCHDAGEAIARGAHGAHKHNRARLPGCRTCHGPGHAVRPVSQVHSPANPQSQARTCGACHGGDSLESFLRSVHGQRLVSGHSDGPTCSTCHGAHEIQRADNVHNPQFKVQMTNKCAGCHEQVGAAFRTSVHGVALLDREVYASASCVDCHMSHQILPAKDPRSSVYPTKVVEDCARCHADEKLIRRFHLPSDVVGTYELSYHGKAGELGEARVANCSSCHRNHGIYRASDPRSSINPKNLQRSCGKCHPGASKNFIKGKIHVSPKDRHNYWAWLVRWLYIYLIILVVGGMVAHNVLDFIRKMVDRAREERDQPHVIRMTLHQRLVHLLLLLSFMFLAYTGFALMYPRAFWAAPLNAISATEAFRSMAHRVAGVVLALLAIYHLLRQFLSRSGRQQRRRFTPRLRDIRNLAQNLAFILGRRRERPRFPHYSYIEKVEYWAVVWGTLVMIATGTVLWFEEQALRIMPLWLWEVVQVVHRYEAILAVLAIFVWHFYAVFLDPDRAPMSLTWLTGRVSVHELALTHPRDLEQAERRNEVLPAAGEAPGDPGPPAADEPEKAPDQTGTR
jgi:formate dehydrogenase gamma subunit